VARNLILSHAKDVEPLTIAEEYEDLTEPDQEEVGLLIREAKVTVTW
jgi:hypothetical protein